MSSVKDHKELIELLIDYSAVGDMYTHERCLLILSGFWFLIVCNVFNFRNLSYNSLSGAVPVAQNFTRFPPSRYIHQLQLIQFSAFEFYVQTEN